MALLDENVRSTLGEERVNAYAVHPSAVKVAVARFQSFESGVSAPSRAI
jgi:hypothetical protein